MRLAAKRMLALGGRWNAGVGYYSSCRGMKELEEHLFKNLWRQKFSSVCALSRRRVGTIEWVRSPQQPDKSLSDFS